MAVLSIDDNPIVQNEYIENDGIVNIEFGSGDGYFGKREYPYCYLTDLTMPNKQHFMQCLPNYDGLDCHYIDFVCDFYDYNFNGRLFEKIILCNPYSFGCNGLLEGKRFFNRAGGLLSNTGQIIIICNKSNPFANEKKIKNYLDCEELNFRSKYDFHITSTEKLDENHRIRKDYIFKYCCLKRNATPDQMITINKISTK